MMKNDKKEIKPSGYWDNKEICHKEALKYDNKKDFQNLSSSARNSARKNGWYEEICSHMLEKKKPNGYWTKENCQEEALKYKTKKDFRKNCNPAIKASKRYGWYNEICSHMIPLGDKYRRLVYVYEFSDNHAYIGLTDNTDRRFRDHMKSGPVFKHIEKSCLVPNYIILSDYIDVGDAQELEHTTKLKYIEEGWNILNKGATGRNIGSLGGTIIKWNYDACKVDAMKYTSRCDFLLYNAPAFRISRKNGWLDDICSHMKGNNQVRNWSYDKCKDEASKYTTRSELKNNNSSVYQKSLKYKWLDDFYTIEKNKEYKGKWTYDICKEESLKYNSRSEFRKGSGGANKVALKNKWLDEFYPKNKKTDI